MAAQNQISFLIILVSAILFSSEAQKGGEEAWAKRVDSGNEVVTSLQFYFHDKLSGQNPSAIMIAQPLQNSNSANLFGNLLMIDDALTVGPDPSSKLVGRARGLYGSAGQTDMNLIMAISYVLSDGIYNGSSFSLLSINQVMHSPREMAIVGGTGLFRLARGYAIAQTYQADASGDAIVGYNVTIASPTNI
ncbi:Disease resistance-responsive family protein [Perilla frutescens var. hirtella]|uniref:Dirigent protein n=1 Tax=Perilla frutescens var. hirtella TaxID=608512 RepID=A0AAD4JFP9_PERFH|nr:Disease resistance-responsive family protein [Perilla frutescens var. hirtella]